MGSLLQGSLPAPRAITEREKLTVTRPGILSPPPRCTTTVQYFLFTPDKETVLVVGLEGAGKKTILMNSKLGLGDVTTSTPTSGECLLSMYLCPRCLPAGNTISSRLSARSSAFGLRPFTDLSHPRTGWEVTTATYKHIELVSFDLGSQLKTPWEHCELPVLPLSLGFDLESLRPTADFLIHTYAKS